ncbi:MAG: SDR family oxidoreductase [Methyloligellaceae bacterium]
MSTSELVLLTGAAGKTGRQVLKALVARQFPVRTLVRRQEQEKAMRSLGAADVAIGDLYDSRSLEAALTDCTKIVHICPPMDPGETEIAETLIELSQKSDIRHFVLYSVLHPLLRDVPHHHRKLEAERALVNSGLTYTILQPARYMQHLLPLWDSLQETGVHSMPFSTDVQFCVVDLADLAEVTALVAAESGHEQATYQLAGPQNLSQADMAEILSRLLNRKITAEPRSSQDTLERMAAAGMSAARIENFRLMNDHYDHYGMTGNPGVLRWLLGREPTSYEEFVRREFLS